MRDLSWNILTKNHFRFFNKRYHIVLKNTVLDPFKNFSSTKYRNSLSVLLCLAVFFSTSYKNIEEFANKNYPDFMSQNKEKISGQLLVNGWMESDNNLLYNTINKIICAESKNSIRYISDISISNIQR